MKKRFSPKKTAAFCTVSVLLALIIWTVWGNTALMVSTAAISSSRIPPAFSGFRIAQVSDLHNAEFGKDNSTLLRMLSESGPDIIVITGDLVDSTHTDIDTALSFAKEAVQIAPVYYVTGNHEARLTEYGRLRTGLETAGVTVLEDKTVWLERDGGKIMLIGLSDPDFTVKGDMFGEVPSMVGTKLESLAGSEVSYISWRRLGSVVAFYSLAGLGGMIVLPASSIMAVTFMLCGALVPAMALLSLAASLVGIEVPWMVMQLGSWTMPPLMAFPVAVVVGLLLLLAGVGMWKVTVGFVRLVGEKRRSL